MIIVYHVYSTPKKRVLLNLLVLLGTPKFQNWQIPSINKLRSTHMHAKQSCMLYPTHECC